MIVLASSPWRWAGQPRSALCVETDWRGVVTAVHPGPRDCASIRVGDVIPWTSVKLGSVLENDFDLSAADGDQTFAVPVEPRHGPKRVAHLSVTQDERTPLLRALSLGEFGMFLTFMLVATVVLVYRPSATARWLYVYAVLSPPTSGILTAFSWLQDAQFTVVWIVVNALSDLWATVPILPFVIAFPDDKRIARYPRLYQSALVFAGVTLLLAFASAIDAARGDGLGRHLLTKSLGATIGLAATIPAMTILLAMYARSRGSERQRLRWAVFGISFTAISSIVPYFDVSEVTASAFLVATAVMPITLAYAILRHHVIDLRVALNRTIVYAVLSSLLVAIIAIVHWAADKILSGQHLAEYIDIAAAVVLGFALNRAHGSIERFIDKVLFWQRHRAQQYLRRAANALPFAREENVVQNAMVHHPVRYLQLASAALYVRDEPRSVYRRVAHAGHGEHPAELDSDDELVRFLREDPSITPVDEAAETLLRAYAVAVPVRVRNDVEAFAVYGIHSDGSALDPTELSLLERLAEGAAAATDHIESLLARRENDALRERVVHAERRAAELEGLLHEGGSA